MPEFRIIVHKYGLTALKLVLLTSLSAPALAQETAFYPIENEARSGLPFSQAVRVGDLLYLSGDVGVDPQTDALVPGGMAAEARQTMTNIGTTLKRFGLDYDHLVKCQVFLSDMSQWGAFNEVYLEFLNPPYPARAALGANGLALGATVEVDCIAAIPPGHKMPEGQAKW